MDKLKSENAKLKDDLLLENKFGVAHSTAATAQIAKLQDQADMFTRKIEMEKRRVAELDKQTALMNQRSWSSGRRWGASTPHARTTSRSRSRSKSWRTAWRRPW